MGIFKNINTAIDTISAQAMNERGTGLGDAPSGYGSEYDRLFQNNPYRNLTYNKSWWQQFLSNLGFRTDYDRWKEDAQVNSGEYDSGIFEMMQQNSYNSPMAQAQRMRDAGMNPDLLGTGDVAPGAKPNEDPNGMSPNVGDELSQFGESFMSVLGKTMTLYKDFKSLGQLDNLIEAGDLENVKKYYDSIDAFLENRFQESDFNNRSSYNKKVSLLKGELENELLGDFESSSAYRAGISKKDWKRWTKSAGERLDSLMGDMTAYGAYGKAGNARIGATQALLNPNYLKTDEQYDMMIGLTPIISSKYAEFLEAKSKFDAYQEQLRQGALENQGMKQDIEGQYLDTLNDMNAGYKQASSEVSKYDADWYQNQLNKSMSDMKKQCLDYLRSISRHNRFAQLMLLNWSLDDMVKLGVNASASASVGLNFGLGASLSNSIATILHP